MQPPSTPSARMISSAALRRRWWTWSGSVWTGATTIESPVCTPSGSTFSMRAHRDARVGRVAHDLVLDLLPAGQVALDDDLADGARRAGRCARVRGTPPRSATMPPPEPPSVNAGRMTAGRPISASAPRVRSWRSRGRRALDHDRRRIGLADLVEQRAEALRDPRPSRSPRAACPAGVSRCRSSTPSRGELHAQVQRRLAAQAGQDAVRMSRARGCARPTRR